MKWGIVMPPHDLGLGIQLAEHAERAGFDLVCVGDTSSLWHDPYVVLSAMAARTSTVRLGVMVTNPFTRHVETTANASLSLDELSAGRLVLGIGRGDNAVRNLGLRPANTAELEAATETLRRRFRDRRMNEPRAAATARSIPVVVAAQGPSTLRLAGRVADGVLVGGGLEATELARSIEVVRSAATAAGRRTDDVEIVALARTATGETRQDAYEAIASLMASVCHHSLADPAAAGVPAELVPAVHELRNRYDPRHHVAPGWSPNARLARDMGLLDYLVHRYAILVPHDDVGAIAARLARSDVDTVLLGINPSPASVSMLDHLATALGLRRRPASNAAT